jgi:Cytosine deaminase and related metal-dependent hydrolases
MRTIAAQYIYPLNSQSPIRRGKITLNDEGVIVDIGEMNEESESTEFYNGILVPGFVNSHCHIELSHLKGKFSRGSGMAGFIRQINLLRESTAKEERLKAIETEMKQLYRSGVSAMGDISNCDESFGIKAKSPIYTRSFLEVFGTEKNDVPDIIVSVKRLSESAAQYGLDAAPTPHSCYTMSPELIKEVSREALKSRLLSYHNQESWEEEELIKSGNGPLADEYKGRRLSTPPITGKSALLYFISIIKELAIKEHNQNILLVHNTFTNEESVDAALNMADNMFWAICPLSNLFIHNALPPIDMLRRKGATITIGTDSLSSNDKLSIVAEIECLHRYFPNIPLGEILEWASFNGAKFLRKENELGSFEIGKKPGVVLIDNIDWNNMGVTDKSISHRLI